MTSLLISLVVGLAIGLLVWQILRLFQWVPRENRQYRDRPPVLVRYLWPLIRLVEHAFGSFMRDGALHLARLKLQRSGLEYAISAAQLVAMRWVFALVCMGIVVLLSASLGKVYWTLALLLGVLGYFYPDLWVRERIGKRKAAMAREIPFFLDVLTLAVEGGSNLTTGLRHVVSRASESPLRSEFNRVLRDVRTGMTRADALHAMVERTDSMPLRAFVSGVLQAENTGSSLGPVLRAQAEQMRTARFQRAEKQAMEAPVKMLAPLVLFIFPATFLVLGFLIVSKLFLQGYFSDSIFYWAWQWPYIGR